MDLQPENCAKCGCLPEDILMLTCNHDLCLVCASKNLQREMHKYGDRTKSIMCELCGAPTILDESSIEELLKIPIDSRQETSNRRLSPQKYSSYQSPQADPKPSRSTTGKYTAPHNENPLVDRVTNQGTDRNTVRGFCMEHPDEEISYFCFDCLNNCICPECVIHGSHRNHDVMTVKKAYPAVKTKIDDLLGGLNSKLEEGRLLEEKCENHKKEVRENNKILKNQVGDLFNEIRSRLDKKEKEIMSNLDFAVEEAVRDINNLAKALENKASALLATFDLVNNHVAAKDDVLLLNFFANNQAKIQQQINSEDFNFKKLGDNFKFKTISNFSEIIDSLNLLQVQVSAVGNVSFDKFQSDVNAQYGSNQTPTHYPSNKFLAQNSNILNRPTLNQNQDSTERFGKPSNLNVPNQKFSNPNTPYDSRKGYDGGVDENQNVQNPYQKHALSNIYKEVKSANFRNFVNLNKPNDFKGGMTFSNAESHLH